MSSAVDAMADSDSMRTIDIMPTNSRDILRWNSYLVAIFSSSFNSLLIAILLTERNAILRAYSDVLMLNCVCDLLYTLATFVSDLQFELNDFGWIFVLGGIYKNHPIGYSYFGIFGYLMGLYISVMVIPIVFYFRHQLVVKNRQMTRSELIHLSKYPICISVMPSMALAVALYLDPRRKTCHEMLNSPMWQYGDPIDKCVMAESSNSLLHLYLVMVTIINSAMYGLMIYFTFAIFRAIKRNKTTVTAKTARLQRQMNILLVVQLILPMICACLPFTAVVVLSILRLRFRGLGVLVILTIEWVPLANPLITILLVTNYRRRTARILMTPLFAVCGWIMPRYGRTAPSGAGTTSHDGDSTQVIA